jgi:hypothetical protein
LTRSLGLGIVVHGLHRLLGHRTLLVIQLKINSVRNSSGSVIGYVFDLLDLDP